MQPPSENSRLSPLYYILCQIPAGIPVAWWLRCWTGDWEVTGSNLATMGNPIQTGRLIAIPNDIPSHTLYNMGCERTPACLKVNVGLCRFCKTVIVGSLPFHTIYSVTISALEMIIAVNWGLNQPITKHNSVAASGYIITTCIRCPLGTVAVKIRIPRLYSWVGPVCLSKQILKWEGSIPDRSRPFIFLFAPPSLAHDQWFYVSYRSR